jgi:hypothetical protein
MPTQTTDVYMFGPDADGLDFQADAETLTIATGVTVFSALADGIASTNSNDTLFNFGQIVSFAAPALVTLPVLAGVAFDGDGGTVVNEAKAGITGFVGVGVNGANDAIRNLGSIYGYGSGVVFSEPSSNGLLVNRASIFGHSVGVGEYSTTGSAAIVNSGLVKSSHDAIWIHSAFVTSITNAASGVIAGAQYAIYSDTQYSFQNYGKVVGMVITGGHSAIANHGSINGEVRLLSGGNVFNGVGGTSGAILSIGDGDRIIAGSGSVAIQIDHQSVGGAGDTLTGGPGADRFAFTNMMGSVDRITNFAVGRDRIVLSKAAFPGIGPVGHALAAADFHIGTHATKASEHIVYDPQNGFLFYDPDGSGPTAQTHFATLSAHPALTSADVLVEA